MHRTLLLGCMVAALTVISPATSLACADGCSSIPLNLNDFVLVQQASGETPCSPACGTNGVQYAIIFVSGCGGSVGTVGTFCSSDVVPPGNYYVQSIGSGCSGTPQGCIRLCSCP